MTTDPTAPQQSTGAPRRDTGAQEGAHAVRVVLVDSQTLVREGLRALLDRGSTATVVADVATLALAKQVREPVDVVVCDVELADGRDRDVVRALSDLFHPAPLVVLTLVDQPSRVQRVLSAGAAAYLLKSAALADLELALRAVAMGETYLQPSLVVELARRRSQVYEARRGVAERLSAMEQRVLRLLALGFTNAEVAEQIGVSVRTVESHRAQLGRKLGGRSRSNLVRQARLLGLDELEEELP
jgi:two-component system response regulator NreC